MSKAIIDETGRKVELIFNGRWVEVELPYSLYDLAALALAQMKPKESGDGSGTHRPTLDARFSGPSKALDASQTLVNTKGR